MIFRILIRHILLGAIVAFLMFWVAGELPYLTIINDRILIWLCISLVMLFSIWTISKTFKQRLLRPNTKKYLFSFTFIFAVWIMLFLATAIIDGISGSFKSGQFEIVDYLEGYVIYRLWVYVLLGLVHGLIGGLLLSIDLKRISSKSSLTG